MKSINEIIGQELQWVHPKVLRGEYELLEGDELYARYHSQSGSGSQVRVESANGNWLIKRKGFSQAITVLAFDSQTELAIPAQTARRRGHSRLHCPNHCITLKQLTFARKKQYKT